jgi:polyphosphate glucokinase
MTNARDDHILAIDVGATFIKFGLVNSMSRQLTDQRRIETPYPCLPGRLLAVLTDEIERSGCSQVGVGFPGDLRDGVVVEPGNLSRVGGILSDIDPAIHDQWVGLDLERALRTATDRDVRVVNDATLAALGCCEGTGRELVVTLGTGFGIAFVVDGVNQGIRDVGGLVFRDSRTYDQLLGEPSRMRDEDRWLGLLHLAVCDFAAEFTPDSIHVGGGNARRVRPDFIDDLGRPVIFSDNGATLRGAAKLFTA